MGGREGEEWCCRVVVKVGRCFRKVKKVKKVIRVRE